MTATNRYGDEEDYDEKDVDSTTTPLVSGNKSWSRSPYDQPFLVQVLMLICVSFLTFGSYFAYDAVSALEEPLKQELGIDAVEFSLLFSVYTFPNIGFVLVGGVLTDKMGNRWSSLLFCSFFVAGSCLVALSAHFQSYHMMLAGRFIFGIGAESAHVVQNNICIEWFSKNKYFALAMGVVLTVSRMGSILAFTTVTKVTSFLGDYRYGLWFGCLLCLVSLLTAVLFCVLDKYFKDKVGFREKPQENTFLCVDPRVLSRSYYLWVLIAILSYSAIYPFMGTASEYIAQKWDISPSRADDWISGINICALVLSSPCGLMVDQTGKSGFLGLLLGVVSYLLMGLTNVNPVIPILILGIHFSLMPAALWPCMAFIVEEKYSGFAFALVTALMNAFLTGSYTISGTIVQTFGFTWFCLFFAGISGLSVVIGIIWNVMDRFQLVPALNTKFVPSVNADILTTIEPYDA